MYKRQVLATAATAAAAAATADDAPAANGGAARVVGPLETNVIGMDSPLGTEVVDVGVEESDRAIVHAGGTPDTGVEIANGNGAIKTDETVRVDRNR